MRRLAPRLLLLLISTLLCLGAAELLFREFGPAPREGLQYYADSEHHEVDLNSPTDMARAMTFVEFVADAPRARTTFKPSVEFYVCYRGFGGREGFDEQGCVPFEINSFGTREREELCAEKPAGQFRVLCLGDSTTAGFGVRTEDCWTRRSEALLRDDDDALRMVNCGLAGTLLPDESALALERRFARYQPDAVLLTLCLNDLLPLNGGMSHFDPASMASMKERLTPLLAWSRLATGLDQLLRQRDALSLDPDHDWVGDLLDLPLDQYPETCDDLGDVFWSSGVPQRALLRIRDWCKAREIPFGVAIWPLLQGLDSREAHPFARMHDLVVEFCTAEQIPVLDLLDAFIGLEPRQLWVSSYDMHGNPAAHRHAAPLYAEFVRELRRSAAPR